ncbi:MAG: hypothetical protein Q7J82_00270 [Coriobacteriia bacterium]|nr:hypothetical protein [Coriobacteriia bacterium]
MLGVNPVSLSQKPVGPFRLLLVVLSVTALLGGVLGCAVPNPKKDIVGDWTMYAATSGGTLVGRARFLPGGSYELHIDIPEEYWGGSDVYETSNGGTYSVPDDTQLVLLSDEVRTVVPTVWTSPDEFTAQVLAESSYLFPDYPDGFRFVRSE